MKKIRMSCVLAFLLSTSFSFGQDPNILSDPPLIPFEIANNTSLQVALNNLAMKIGANVVYSDPALKEHLLFGYSGKSVSPDQILQAISDQSGLQITYQDKVISVVDNSFYTELDDIVVVAIGYGNKEKQRITTAVSEVDMKLIENRSTANAVTALQGTTPGLNITNTSGKDDSETHINIRGFNSINGGSPLVIIDGVEGNLSTLNPNDIKSISVLKDAGASAVYGARGAFGVVLVSTKNAEVGKIKVSVNSTLNILSQTQNTDFVTDPYQAAKLVDDAFLASTGKTYTGYNDYDYQQLLLVSKNPSLARVEVQNRNGRDQYVHYGNTDWWDYFWKDTRYSYINDASISGGSENVKGYFSFRNYQTDGLLKVQNDSYARNNVRAKFDIKLNEWITFTTNNQYFRSSDLAHGGSQYGWGDAWSSLSLVHALPSYVPINPDGNALWRTELNNYTIGDGLFASLLHGKSKRETTSDEFSTSNALDIRPFDGFNIHADYTFKRGARKIWERSTKIPYSISPNVVEYFGENKLNTNFLQEDYNAFNLFGNYQLSLGSHNVDIMGGFNQESFHSVSTQASIQGLISDDMNNPGLGSSNPEVTGSAYEWALRGYFYRVSYDFAGKYLIEFNGRYDGTSKFPTDSRWSFFPSYAIGWNVANESFFKRSIPFWNQLKLRASYGESGNQNIGAYAYIPTLNKAIDNGYALDGAKLDYISAPSLNPKDITWERVNTLNLGLDIGMFNNKFQVNFDWFQKDINGMLTQGKTLPGVIGTPAPRENAADLRTKGFELAIAYNDSFMLNNSPFNFSIGATLADSKTRIVKFDNPKGILTDYYKGMELGEIWGYEVDGLFQSEQEILGHADQSYVSADLYSLGGLKPGDVKFVDRNGDGFVNNGNNTLENPGDMKKIGNSTPRYTYSIRLALDYKGFDFSAFLQGVMKQNWYPNTDSRMFWAMYSRPYNSYIRKDLADDIWTPDNTEGYFPRLVGYTSLGNNRQLGVANDRYMQDISYLRVKNITVGYTFPKSLVNRIEMESIRIYVSGENLFTFSKLTDYIDPEAASNSFNFNSPSSAKTRTTAQGQPFSKIYSFGVQLNF